MICLQGVHCDLYQAGLVLLESTEKETFSSQQGKYRPCLQHNVITSMIEYHIQCLGNNENYIFYNYCELAVFIFLNRIY